MTSRETNHTPEADSGELFSMLLRLHPLERGYVAPGSGNQVHAAFLDMIREADPVLSDYLHTPNQRRPYTLGLLQGFHHLTASQLTEIMARQQSVEVAPGQVYWLRITMLDANVFRTFVQSLIARPHKLTLRIGNAQFEISRILQMPEANQAETSWVAYTSFAELGVPVAAQKRYTFEFAAPTAFSKGQKRWGKLLKLFPEPADVFEGLARQWDLFAPAHLRLAAREITPRHIADWCEEQVIVTHYNLETRYLPSSKFGQTGFQGTITYEVKGDPTAPEAVWLTPLARFALFGGSGYKTTMGMGQVRCISLSRDGRRQQAAEEGTGR